MNLNSNMRPFAKLASSPEQLSIYTLAIFNFWTHLTRTSGSGKHTS